MSGDYTVAEKFQRMRKAKRYEEKKATVKDMYEGRSCKEASENAESSDEVMMRMRLSMPCYEG